MEPYFDPLWKPMDAIEQSIEQSFESGIVYYPNPDDYMDDLGRTLGAVEAGTEGAVIPPPAVPEIEPTGPDETWRDVVQAPVSDGPPPPPEQAGRTWASLEPAAAGPILFRMRLKPTRIGYS